MGQGELLEELLRERAALATLDPSARRAVRARLHMKHYLPFYVLFTVWVVLAGLFPTIQDRVAPSASEVRTTSGGDEITGYEGEGDSGAITGDAPLSAEVGPVAGGPGGAPGSAARAEAPGSAVGSEPRGAAAESAADANNAPPPAAAIGSGVTREGVECKPGVRQVVGSTYSAPCVGKYTGDNGGGTFRGVTADKIKLIERNFPETANSAAVAAIGDQAGFASAEETKVVQKVFLDHFNQVYELYGRQVELVEYESQNGDETAEAQSKGREGACLDAEAIVKEQKAFGVHDLQSEPFSGCAAERQLLVFQGGAYFPEKYYRDWHPYVWGIVMECERIGYHVAEYIGKRLAKRKAKWAGDPLIQAKERLFATYVPNNDGYQRCVNIAESELQTKYGVAPGPRYNYTLDVSRFPDEAARGVVQFSAAGATTVTLACDPISIIFLTQSANTQNWRPEWYIIGVALQDTDNLARLYDQQQVNGHLFGMSQLGATPKVVGPESEPGRVYKKITGKDLQEGNAGDYFGLVHTFNLLQAAGPTLTPANIARGAFAMAPSGGPEYAAGYWSFADGPDGAPGGRDHTEIDDTREVYWVGSATSPDGMAGTYVETYGGKRFRNGEWDTVEPPIYPTGS